ncbi:MAG: cytosine deaminase [Defluviicoccus sp.]|nr:cytosine deaminase [Defluviicoccus sp.]MDE0277941.1 cytosine deaminase [Defluviicoccus sp.]
MTGLVEIPDAASFVLADARVPACLVDDPPPDAAPDAKGLLRLDIEIADGRIVGLAAHRDDDEAAGRVDLGGGMVWPGLVDLHTHLDKAFTSPRCPNQDGSLEGALSAVAADRPLWTPDDLRARMEFALRCALAHGTVALRTHIDSRPPRHLVSWPVFRELRDEWRGRIALQAVSLVPLEAFADADYATEIADLVRDCGGVLGAVTGVDAGNETVLDRVFGLADERGLDLDFHADETDDPGARSFDRIARAAIAHRFEGRVVVGHCCSLAMRPADEADRALDLAAAAGLHVVSLPMCNLYLQDRRAGRTPRWRGVTLLHEMTARGIPVSLASDNVRDPFHAYGDFDMLEVFAQAVKIAHLDRPVGDWPAAVTRTPAGVMGLADAGRLRVGGPADLVLFRARFWGEMLSRPQHDRIVLRVGRPIDAAPPDYRELDRLFE